MKYFKYLLMGVVFGFCFLAYPQEASGLPAKIGSSGDFFDSVIKILTDKAGIITMVLAVLFGVAKRVSTEKAGKIVSLIQMLFDKLAYAMIKLGELLKLIADFLAKVLASDGLLGKQ